MSVRDAREMHALTFSVLQPPKLNRTRRQHSKAEMSKTFNTQQPPSIMPKLVYALI